MPRIKVYNRLEPLTELGRDAKLIVGSICYDVSNINFKEMLENHEFLILAADDQNVTLKSEEIGTWQFNHEARKWRKVDKNR